MAVIAGKDRSVEDTIRIVKKILLDGGFDLEEKELLNPVHGIWSVNLQDKDSQFYTNGKGSTKENAIASAYCEFLERLGSGFFFYDYAYDGLYNENSWVYAPDEVLIVNKNKYKEELLNDDLWNFYDSENDLNFNTFTDSGRCNPESIIALPFQSGSNNSKINIPVELLKSLYASNGLSAGNTEKEAIVQGLSESIERGVKNYIISESLSLPNISEEYLKSNNFLPIIKEIESYGYPVVVKDASLGGRFPVICALLIENNTGKVLSSFGAHPNPQIAIERTLTELLQGRKIASLDGFSSLTYNYDQVADESNLESHFINSSGVLHINIVKEIDDKMVLWNFDGNRDKELLFLNELLEKEEYEYFYRAYKIGEMWVAQSIIPKLSEIYPVEDLIEEHRNTTSSIRELFKIESWSNKLIKNSLNWFEECYIPGSRNILEYLGISISEDDPLYDINADEIELLLLISKKLIKKVHGVLQHQVVFESINKKRVGFWSCLLSKLEGIDNKTLNILFSKSTFEMVESAINGEIPRELYPVLGFDFSYIKQHKDYSNVYKKYIKMRS